MGVDSIRAARLKRKRRQTISFINLKPMYGDLVPIGGGDPIPLRKPELVIGRREDCDIVLRFSNVSGKHCRLVLSCGYWYVLDLQSTNGVRVGGVKVSDHRIDPGQTLLVAKHGFAVEYSPTKNGATGPPPGDVLQEGNLMSQSLMEKVGLQKPARKAVDSGSTIPDMPVVEVATPSPAPQKPVGPRDFFAELEFD